jgi:hypothetical protein
MRATWWLLRAHVEARLVAAGTPALREERARELQELETMGEAFSLAAVPSRTGRERWLFGWAIAASLLALGLGLWLLGRDGAPRALAEGAGGAGDGSGGYAVEGAGAAGSGEGDAEVIPREERARVVVDAGVEDARIEIADAASGELVAEGTADGGTYWLAPGSYALRVGHPDCADDWQQVLAAEAGSDHALAPEICGETGWLVVQANVEGARVVVDGRPVGETGPERRPVPAGEREVRVEAPPGYEAWEGIVDLEPRRSLTLRPRLLASAEPERTAPSESAPAPSPVEAAAAAPPPRGPDAAPRESARAGGLEDEEDPDLAEGWHHETRQWLLARYDTDRSGAIDRPEELDAIPCDYWKGIERSYDASRLGLPLLRMYGFDGDGWKRGALGIGSSVRDLAFRRMRDCGLRY